MKKHIRPISIAQAEPKQDGFGAVFFQIWLSVFTWILAGAFGKNR